MGITTATISQDATFALMGRFEVDGVVGLQANVSTVTITGTDQSTGSSVLSVTPTVSAIVFDTLQTDARWGGKDALGYNFRYDVADTICVTPGIRYRFKVVITTASGKLKSGLFEVVTESEL